MLTDVNTQQPAWRKKLSPVVVVVVSNEIVFIRTVNFIPIYKENNNNFFILQNVYTFAAQPYLFSYANARMQLEAVKKLIQVSKLRAFIRISFVRFGLFTLFIW